MNEKAAEGLKKFREKRQELKAQGIVLKKKNPREKWESDKKSLRKAINAKCWECSVEQKSEITLCTMKECPLWLIRPYQKDSIEETQEDSDIELESSDTEE